MNMSLADRFPRTARFLHFSHHPSVVYEIVVGQNWTTQHLKYTKSVGLDRCVTKIEIALKTDSGIEHIIQIVPAIMGTWNAEVYAPSGPNGTYNGGDHRKVEDIVLKCGGSKVTETGPALLEGKPYMKTVIYLSGKPSVDDMASSIDNYSNEKITGSKIQSVTIPKVTMTKVPEESYQKGKQSQLPLSIVQQH